MSCALLIVAGLALWLYLAWDRPDPENPPLWWEDDHLHDPS